MNKDRFKFRAWDSNKNKIIYVGDGNLFASNVGEMLNSFEDEDLMQCSGQKDKNGKLIFEGDVVYIAGYGEYTCQFPFIELYDLDDSSDVGEILGNVYENPKLMNNQTIESMLEEIRDDLDGRRGLYLDIDLYKEHIKQDWINIVKKHLNKEIKLK
jgi:hypothetical protein